MREHLRSRPRIVKASTIGGAMRWRRLTGAARRRAIRRGRQALLGGLNSLPLLSRVPPESSASDTIPAGEDNK